MLITGGLGPTLDDLTRSSLAAVLGVPLVQDAESLRQITDYFARRGRPMPASNRVQAEFPEGAAPLPNPVGTAPGMWIEAPRPGREPCRVAALPGPPSEMQPMFRRHVEPRLAGGAVIRRAVLNCIGLGESHTEELLGDLTRRGADPEVGITAHDATISLRIIAQGATAEECATKIARATAIIEDKLGDHIFGRDDEEPEHVVVRLLAERGMTLATAEVATGGNLIERCLKVPAASGVCRGGLVLTDLRTRLPDEGASGGSSNSGDDGRGLARRMAAACRERFGADIGLAISPCLEVMVSGATGPVGVAYAAVSSVDGELTCAVRQTGNPAIFAPRTSKGALDLLRRKLLGLPTPDEA